jgi:hypothetical protein
MTVTPVTGAEVTEAEVTGAAAAVTEEAETETETGESFSEEQFLLNLSNIYENEVQTGFTSPMSLDLDRAQAALLASNDPDTYSKDYYYRQLDASNTEAYDTFLGSMTVPDDTPVTVDTSSSQVYILCGSKSSSNYTDEEKSALADLAMSVFSPGLTAFMLD